MTSKLFKCNIQCNILHCQCYNQSKNPSKTIKPDQTNQFGGQLRPKCYNQSKNPCKTIKQDQTN